MRVERLLVFVIWIVQLCDGLVVVSPSSLLISHTKSRFGLGYGNGTVVGFLKEVEPLDACGSILTNLSDSIALAIRGGSPKCSFAEKVMHVSTYSHSHL